MISMATVRTVKPLPQPARHPVFGSASWAVTPTEYIGTEGTRVPAAGVRGIAVRVAPTGAVPGLPARSSLV